MPTRADTVTDRWVPSPTNSIANRKLLHPDVVDVQDLMDDQDVAPAVVRRSLRALERARQDGCVSAATANRLRPHLAFTATGIEVLRAVHLTAFGTQAMLGLRADNASALPSDTAFLHGVVRAAMATLRNASAARLPWPVDPANIDRFIADARIRLGSLIPPVPPAGYRFVGAGACRDASGRYPQWGERRGVTQPQCADSCNASAPCEAFMVSSGGCQYFCRDDCALCPHPGNGGGAPTTGDGTAGQACMVKSEKVLWRW